MSDIQIKTFTPKDHKIKALIYGAAGSGKTVFAGTAPNAIFASAEGGLLSVADKAPDFVDIKAMRDLTALYQYLEAGDHKYETVIIDSITEINEIVKLEIEKRTGHSLQLQDCGEVAAKMSNLLRKFRDLPMNVLFIAQEQYINDEQKIKKITPELNGKSATAIARFMDIVGYIHIETDGTRWIETSTNKNLLTKDRTQKIGDQTPMDFAEWLKAAATIKTGEQKVKVELETVEAPKVATPGRPHLLAFQKELVRRGGNTKAAALNILNKSLGMNSGTLDFTEEEASSMLVQLLQVPLEAQNAEVEQKAEESTTEEAEAPINAKEKAVSDYYSDPEKVKKLLEKLTTVKEVLGLAQEVQNVYNEGDMTKASFEELQPIFEAKVQKINDALVAPKKAGRPRKVA